MLAVWWRETFTMTIVLYLRLNSIWNFCLYLYFVFIYFVYYCGGSRWRCDEERHSPWQWRGAIYIAILSDPGIKERKITIYWQQGNILGERFFFTKRKPQDSIDMIRPPHSKDLNEISKDVVVFHWRLFIAGSLDIWIGPKIGEIRRRPLKHSDHGSLRRTQPAIRLWCSLSQKVK